MITRQDLERNFSEVILLEDGSYKFKDRLSNTTYFYHARLGVGVSSQDLLTVSCDVDDDEFAADLFRSQSQVRLDLKALVSASVVRNDYGFERVLFAPPSYHKYMKGRLDNERAGLFLCMPYFVSEFTGDEDVGEFESIRLSGMDSLKWNRTVKPKISMRVDNPSTGVSTGADYILAPFEQLMQEVSRLGSGQGFVEIANYRSEVREVVVQGEASFGLIHNRDDSRVEVLTQSDLKSRLWEFVSQA